MWFLVTKTEWIFLRKTRFCGRDGMQGCSSAASQYLTVYHSTGTIKVFWMGCLWKSLCTTPYLCYVPSSLKRTFSELPVVSPWWYKTTSLPSGKVYKCMRRDLASKTLNFSKTFKVSLRDLLWYWWWQSVSAHTGIQPWGAVPVVCLPAWVWDQQSIKLTPS